MIPVGLPDTKFVLMVLAMLIATVGWSVWTLRIVFLKRSRQTLSGLRLGIYIALGAIAVFNVFKFVQLQVHMNNYKKDWQRHYLPVLQSPERLGGIDMPAGTQLKLAVADARDSFEQASFPEPIAVAGIQASQIARYVRVVPDGADEDPGFTALNMRVTGQGVSVQEGWRCDASSPVIFTLNGNGQPPIFERCTLADGNAVDGSVLPSGTDVWLTEGTVYLDGFVDKDRWILDVPTTSAVEIDGLVLSGPVLKLDQNRRLYRLERGTLKQDTRFGSLVHANGTTASLNPRGLSAALEETWVFKPSQQAEPGPEATKQVPILQDRSGAELPAPDSPR